MYLYCVAKENNDLLLYFCACGENVGKNQANKKAKRLIVNRLAFHSVPRPAFEIYKLGTILLNRKLKKNKALYTNIQYITNAHIVNSI